MRERGSAQSVSGIKQLVLVDTSDGCEMNSSVYHVYPVSQTTSEERAWNVRRGWGGVIVAFSRKRKFPKASGYIVVGVVYTRDVRSSQWSG